MKKALVLSSGGVDSTTCISIAIKDVGVENVVTVSAFYGQKHFKELECAKRIAEYFVVDHYVIDLSKIGVYNNESCTLMQGSSREIDHRSYAEQIKDTGKVSTYVPFRNGLLLSSVAALAMSLFPEDMSYIYLGAHADDAAGNAYPDCSQEFTEAMYQAIYIGTYKKVCVVAPLVQLNKAQVVKIGLQLGTPYELTWSCYEGAEKPCGKCGTCIDRAKAFAENGIADPALEEV